MIKNGLMAIWLSVMMKSMQPMESYTNQIKSDSSGIADMVLGGIMIVVIGFAMIIIGVYIYFTIQTSLPNPWAGWGAAGTWTAQQNASATAYNSTVASSNSYATTVFPLMGLVLMILGFSIIFIALRSGLSGSIGGGMSR